MMVYDGVALPAYEKFHDDLDNLPFRIPEAYHNTSGQSKLFVSPPPLFPDKASSKQIGRLMMGFPMKRTTSSHVILKSLVGPLSSQFKFKYTLW